MDASLAVIASCQLYAAQVSLPTLPTDPVASGCDDEAAFLPVVGELPAELAGNRARDEAAAKPCQLRVSYDRRAAGFCPRQTDIISICAAGEVQEALRTGARHISQSWWQVRG